MISYCMVTVIVDYDYCISYCMVAVITWLVITVSYCMVSYCENVG